MQRCIYSCRCSRPLLYSSTRKVPGVASQQLSSGCWLWRELGKRSRTAGAIQTRLFSELGRDGDTGVPVDVEVRDAAIPGQTSERSAKPTKAVQETTDPIELVDLRVGRINSVEKHLEADMLYVLSVETGEYSGDGNGSLPKPHQMRTIVSGLVEHYSPEQLLGRHVVLFANLKPRKLRGILSQGMLLAASSSPDHGPAVVEILEPPATSYPGESVLASLGANMGADSSTNSEPMPNKPLVKKQRHAELFISGLTLQGSTAFYRGRKLLTSAGGEIATKTLEAGVVG